MASNLENNAPALIVNLLQEAFGLLHPTGEARECLADALEAANQLLQWFNALRANGIEVNPTWTAFHTEYMQTKKQLEEAKKADCVLVFREISGEAESADGKPFVGSLCDKG